MNHTATVIPFPDLQPRLVTAAPPALSFTAERFDVITPWIRLTVPLKAGPHAAFTACTPHIQQGLGRDVFSATSEPHRLACDDSRDHAFQLLLIRGELELAPASKSRTQAALTLQMEAECWKRIEALAAYYGTTPLAVVHAGLLSRLDGLRAFARRRATAGR